MKNKFLLILLLTLTIKGQAQTALLENFGYGTMGGGPADSLTNPSIGGGVWRWHSGTTMGAQVVYQNTSLNYTGYPSNSNGVGGSASFTFGSGSRQDVHRRITSFNSGDVYISFLLNMSNAGDSVSGDYFFHVLDTTAMTSFRSRVYIKRENNSTSYKIGFNKGSSTTPNFSSNTFNVNSNVLVVIKYKFTSGTSNDTTLLFAFTGAIPATEPSVATAIAPDLPTADLNVLNAIAIRQGSIGTMNGTIDGIRVSNTWGMAPLPVTLTSFTASIDPGYGTQLKWSTSQELNNAGFEIERSLDGENFETVAFEKGAGNSKTIREYMHSLPYFDAAYYRLKQVDFDGSFDYSPIVFTGNSGSEIDLTPNPFVESFKLNSTSTIDRIEIIDITGKVIYAENINQMNAEVKTSQLAKGIYFINIFQGESIESRRIIKTN